VAAVGTLEEQRRPFVVVLGGAGLVMFGMVAATGARILTAVDFKNNRYNLFVVAISVGFGMIPLVSPNFFKNLPHDLHPLLESGILLSALVAVTLAPAARHALFASHRSAEPGHAVALAHLGLAPYLDLEMRLGEGTGAALFIHLVRAAAAIYGEMATFKSAGVDGPSGRP